MERKRRKKGASPPTKKMMMEGVMRKIEGVRMRRMMMEGVRRGDDKEKEDDEGGTERVKEVRMMMMRER